MYKKMAGEKQFVSGNLWRGSSVGRVAASSRSPFFFVPYSQYASRLLIHRGFLGVGGAYGSRSHPLRLRSRPGRCSAG